MNQFVKNVAGASSRHANCLFDFMDAGVVAKDDFAHDLLFLYKLVVPKAGVLAVVAVVTHHKVAVLRHLVGAIIAHRGAVSDKVIAQLNGFAVCLGHIDGAVLDLHRFAWQPDNALYIILALIVRVFEDHHIGGRW